ncbi:hypothetical protein [uncultured Hymenobacter sp.]|uniref:hypothetical protein n=1 Tax=uncultured Hymenobacter sp. TaxID=170016 RepID=UPI0035CC7ECE
MAFAYVAKTLAYAVSSDENGFWVGYTAAFIGFAVAHILIWKYAVFVLWSLDGSEGMITLGWLAPILFVWRWCLAMFQILCLMALLTMAALPFDNQSWGPWF